MTQSQTQAQRDIQNKPATHTPGPWHFDQDWGRLPTIFGADWKTKIAIVEKNSRNEHTTEQAANARLIAAAPGMLAALKEMVDEADSVSREHGWPLASRLDKARAAIAKAEGREP